MKKMMNMMMMMMMPLLTAASTASPIDTDSAVVQVPYYECIYTLENEASKEPGVCSYFHSHLAPVPVPSDGSDLAMADALAACEGNDEHLAALNAKMALALTGGWNEHACASYIRTFVNSELRSRRVAPSAALGSTTGRLYASLNAITAAHPGMVEGNIAGFQSTGGGNDNEALAAALKRKRTCLTTTMGAAAGRAGVTSRIAEIGFNAGHSAATLLTAMPHASLTSFDICGWPYTVAAFAFLRSHFGSRRLQLVCGDSRETVAAFDTAVEGGSAPAVSPAEPKTETAEEKDKDEPSGGYPPVGRFDAVFIDGGHLFQQALTDMENMARLAKPGALVVVDDCEMSKAFYDAALARHCNKSSNENNSNKRSAASKDEARRGGSADGSEGDDGVDNDDDVAALLLPGCKPFAGSVGQAWRHAVASGIIVEMTDVCGHVGLCLGHFSSS